MKDIFTQLANRMDALAIFRGLLDDPVLERLNMLLQDLRDFERNGENPEFEEYSFFENMAISDTGGLASEIYKAGGNLSKHLLGLVLEDENVYIKKKAKEEKIPRKMADAVAEELAFFEELSSLTSGQIRKTFKIEAYLPSWNTSKIDFAKEYAKQLENIHKRGYGIYARYNAFLVKSSASCDWQGEGLPNHGDRVFSDNKSVIVPVKNPDKQSLEELYGYEREKDLIVKNTEALLYKGGCNNVLLYGDAGTGKSSTIKAIANKYADEGLRIVEVKKNQLFMIPDIIEELSDIPLKFILYIDDLSFTKNDDNFSALKAILEGSITAAGDNVAVYATSNRRHLVKENFSDREGGEVHVSDTLQETFSLSARFGLMITFQKPDKDEYLAIVESLAKEAKLKMPKAELFERAEAFAIRANGRTPRAAKQFVTALKIGM